MKKKTKFQFPFQGFMRYEDAYIRTVLVGNLNTCQDQFTFSTFTNNKSNFYSDGCIYAVKKGQTATNRKNKTVIFCQAYGASVPSVYADGITQFDSAYIAARTFIRDHCGI